MKYITHFLLLIILTVSSLANAEVRTFKKATMGFQISNPHDLNWFDPEEREEAKKMSKTAKGNGGNTAKLLLALGYKKDDIAEGAISITYLDHFDRTKPLRFFVGNLVNKIRKIESDDVIINGEYVRTEISGVPALYYKVAPVYPNPEKLNYRVNAHFIAFKHQDKMFMLQSGVNVYSRIGQDKMEIEFEKFHEIFKDTAGTIVLND